MNILLFCNGGLSTSLLVSKMQKEALLRELDAHIVAVGAHQYLQEMPKFDVCLIGPQVRFRLAEAKAAGLKHKIPVDVINMMDYGTCNGKNVLDQALTLLNVAE